MCECVWEFVYVCVCVCVCLCVHYSVCVTGECYAIPPGLLRGVDPERRVLYLTTPEDVERLTQVNILVAGNSDSPDFMVSPSQV